MYFCSGSTIYSHKSVQKLFHNLHIIFSNSLIGFKVICHLEKEPLKGLANVQEIFSKTISWVIDLQLWCQEHLTGLLLSNLCKNIVKKLIWKFVDIFLNQVLNFLNIFTEHGNIIAGYTKSIERISQLLCGMLF